MIEITAVDPPVGGRPSAGTLGTSAGNNKKHVATIRNIYSKNHGESRRSGAQA